MIYNVHVLRRTICFICVMHVTAEQTKAIQVTQ